MANNGWDMIDHVEKTREYLEKLGLNIDVSLELNPEVKGYDLIHIFNLQKSAVQYSFQQILNAKNS